MEALGQLAERSERLILHDRRDGVDSYLIDDQGTLYRYRDLRNGVGGGGATGADGHGAATVTINGSTGSQDAAGDGRSAGRSPVLALDAITCWPYAHAPGEAGEADEALGVIEAGDTAESQGSPVLVFAAGMSAAATYAADANGAGAWWPYAEASGDGDASPSIAGHGKSAESSSVVAVDAGAASLDATADRREHVHSRHLQQGDRPRQAALRLAVTLAASAVTWRLLRTAASRMAPRRHAAPIGG
jgi:hypothetical protein